MGFTRILAANHKISASALFLLLFFFLLPSASASAEPGGALEIIGPGVETPGTFKLSELEAREQYEHIYSAVNTYPTKQWYVARGVLLKDLLGSLGLRDEATLIRFYSQDGYDVVFTVQELLVDKRYYFPKLKDNHPSDGSVPGSSEDAEEVETILALVSAEGSDNPEHMNTKDTLQLILGQRAVTEQVSTLFVKNINKIEVLTKELEQWDRPRMNVPEGFVLPPGAKLILQNKNSDTDKIYYTIDGSPPTVDSPMFNWSASRWWPLRGDLDKINAPLKITDDILKDHDKQTLTIKARTIGPGKKDSDIVTFTFYIDPDAVDPTLETGGPTTGVFLDRQEIELPVGGTFQLEARVEPFNADNKHLIWRSNDTTVAVVDTQGLVTMVGTGSAVITVETVEGGHRATCLINGTGGEEEDKIEVEEYLVEGDNNVKADPVEGGGVDPAETAPSPVSDERLSTDRWQYLISRDELSSPTIDGTPGKEQAPLGQQIFAMSVVNPTPLQADNHELSTTLIFLFLLLSGAGIKYSEYVKEL